MAWRHRTGQWRRLINNLGELARVPSRISKVVASEITILLKKEFAEGANPYGTPWIPLRPSTIRKKKGDTRIMLETNAARDETEAFALPGAGIGLRSADYIKYHQGPAHDGSRPARIVLPNKKELPVAWQTVIAKAWEREFQRTMNR